MSTAAVKSCCFLYSLLLRIFNSQSHFQIPCLVIFFNGHLKSLVKMYLE